MTYVIVRPRQLDGKIVGYVSGVYHPDHAGSRSRVNFGSVLHAKTWKTRGGAERFLETNRLDKPLGPWGACFVVGGVWDTSR